MKIWQLLIDRSRLDSLPEIFMDNEGHSLLFIIYIEGSRIFPFGAYFTLRQVNEHIGRAFVSLSFPMWYKDANHRFPRCFRIALDPDITLRVGVAQIAIGRKLL
jgi:hypothetical protein